MLMKTALRSTVAAAAVLALTAATASAAPKYALLTTVSLPGSTANPSATGALNTYDISFFDSTTGNYYLGDRSNGGIDVLSSLSNSYIQRIGVGTYSGQTTSNNTSGPDGVMVANTPSGKVLFGGNGDSTVKAYNVGAGYSLVPNFPVATGPASANRVDEMAYDSRDNIAVVANNAAAVPFVTEINPNTGAILSKIVFDGTNGTPIATNGAEQSVYSPQAQAFFIAIPEINGNGSGLDLNGNPDPGGVAEIDPSTGKVVKTFNLTSFGISYCTTGGLAINTKGQLLIGCSGTGPGSGAVLFDPAANGGAGAVLNVFKGVNGSDEVYYDPTNQIFAATTNTGPGGTHTLSVIDDSTANGSLVQTLTTTGSGSDHSVAIDPLTNEIFVPFAAGALNSVCPNGCIGVFAQVVPEPGTLPILLTAMVGFIGLAVRRRFS